MITASLTTIREREASLKETIESLLPQVNKLNVYLHGYDYKPDFLHHKKIEVAFDLEWGDHTDLDKFSWVDEVKGYHLICDDDLIYPPNYAKYMCKKIDEYKRKAVISCHGVNPHKPPIASYYLDRTVYPCLATVDADYDVKIAGTGALAYYTDKPLDFKFDDKTPKFMADIHFSLYCLKNKMPMKVVAHKEGWIKHSEKVDLNKTIFADQVHRDYIQTKYINDNKDLFFDIVKYKGNLPLVAVTIINSRQLENVEWYKEALDSIRSQTYPNIEIITIQNLEKIYTIGKCWNDAAEMTKAKYILYIGDDDFITHDYVESLVSYVEKFDRSDISGATSFLHLFEVTEKGVKEEARKLIPTGLWKTEVINKVKFAADRVRLVDSEFMDRAEKSGYKQLIARWHYGYYYRSHPRQISGHKLFVSEGVTTEGRYISENK